MDAISKRLPAGDNLHAALHLHSWNRAGEQKAALAREYDISRETLYQYL
jgi:hypothetical protein